MVTFGYADWTELRTVENRGNMEITKTMIFDKCCDFAKMPYF